MDAWLDDEIKALFAKPCMALSESVGSRLENRLRMGQPIDERALTEDFVDAMHTGSSASAWGTIVQDLQDREISVSTKVTKSTFEKENGADLGVVLHRKTRSGTTFIDTSYAALIQCKYVDSGGHVKDFFHKVKSSGRRQSSLMLDITPASFYVLYVPPSLLRTFTRIEWVTGIATSDECTSPIRTTSVSRWWNSGVVDNAASLLVIPALAVNAHQALGKSASIKTLLPNAMPFWYWFAELFVTGFVGDTRKSVIQVATNTTLKTPPLTDDGFGVRDALEMYVESVSPVVDGLV